MAWRYGTPSLRKLSLFEEYEEDWVKGKEEVKRNIVTFGWYLLHSNEFKGDEYHQGANILFSFSLIVC